MRSEYLIFRKTPIGDILASWRYAAGLSTSAAAERLNTCESSIYRYEHNKRAPSLPVVLTMIEEYDIDVDTFEEQIFVRCAQYLESLKELSDVMSTEQS